VARARLEECARLAAEVGARAVEALAHQRLAGIDAHEGRYAEALRGFDRSNRVLQEEGQLRHLAWGYGMEGVVHWWSGDAERAHQAVSESLALHRLVRHPLGEAWAMTALAQFLLEAGEVDEARIRFEEALELQSRVSRLEKGWALNGLAVASLRAGDVRAARRQLLAALAANRRDRVRRNDANIVVHLGHCELLDGRPLEAVRLVAVAAAIRMAVGFTDVETSPNVAHNLDAARAVLGEEAVEAAWHAGLEEDPDAVLDELLGMTPPSAR
jgi:tetratricopeptide (TPR) repeat protein